MAKRLKHTIFGIEKSATGHLEIARQLKKSYGVGSYMANRDLKYMIEYLNYWRGENLGIEKIKVVREPYTGIGKGIEVYRVGEDFGETISIAVKKKTKEYQVKAAFREAIHKTILEFKNKSFLKTDVVECPIEGIPVYKHTCHVDHYELEFDEMLLNFLKEKNMDIEEVGLTKSKKGVGTRLADENLKLEFSNYHDDNTKLRIVSKWANLSTLRKKS